MTRSALMLLRFLLPLLLIIRINAEPLLANIIQQERKTLAPKLMSHNTASAKRKLLDEATYSYRFHQNPQTAGKGLKKLHEIDRRVTTMTTRPRNPIVPGCTYHGSKGCYSNASQNGFAKGYERRRTMIMMMLKTFHSLKKRDDEATVISAKNSFSRNKEEKTRAASENSSSNNELTVELGLFIDDALWIHFQKLYETDANSELQTYAFAIINNINSLFRHSSLKPPIQLIVNYYEVMKVPPAEMSRNLHGNGDAIRLLDLFCDYQAKINRNSTYSKRWDHALLFTGYDLHRGKIRTVAGYAPVKGMCTETRSCTISEGLDFGAVFVVAHEMGHSLGMSHDGDNGCDPSCCIMSTSVGTGRTLWSPCSVRDLNNFIAQLDEKGPSNNCMRTMAITSSNEDRKRDIRAGQMYTLDEQCISFHGECWRHELKHGQHINDVCQMVWCGNGEGVIRSAHPALEYTYCGYQTWCKEGRCALAAPEEMIVQHGGWSDWNDSGPGSCISECLPCQIAGQLRLRRSTRICDNPFPKNGGSYCYGDDARGIRCQEEKCNGISIEQFATESCTKLRDSGDSSTKILTGKGLQYDSDLCKIWCVLPHEQIRTTANFPDGTPCGTNRYCVKGRCRNLDCNGRAVVALRSHCPPQYLFTQDGDVRSRKRVPVNTSNNNSIPAYRKMPHPYAELWTSWSQWSSCTVTACQQQGFRLRKRTCLIGSVACDGFQRQRKVCYGTCTAEKMQWSAWSQCSTSCGFGVERRVRHCPTCTKNDSLTEDTRTCFLKKCEVTNGALWSSWGPWEPCNCTGRYRIRRRKCLHMRCKGHKVELTKCKETECTESKSKSSTPSWVKWSE